MALSNIQFQLLARQLAEMKNDLRKIADNATCAAHKSQLQKMVAHLKREKNGLKRFHKALIGEVEDEIGLRLNYSQITQHLAELEDEVRLAAEAERAPQTERMLPRIELQIDVLKKQCRAARKFVELSVDGSASSSPSRRKRIILRLCSSVTKIIQVET